MTARDKGPEQLALEAEFPKEMLDTVRKGGSNLTYVPVAEVIDRLNRVIGPGNWSWEVTKVWRDGLDPDWVLACGNLTMTIDGVTSTKGGTGGVKCKRLKPDNANDPNGIVDLGDEFKGAESDALKKAAQRFGVALYLGRTTEARRYEAPEPVVDQRAKDDEIAREKGWSDFATAKAESDNLAARIKDAGDTVAEQMRAFREKNSIEWPPTRQQWLTVNGYLIGLLRERTGGPDSSEKPAEGGTAQPDSTEAEKAVRDAFPGSKNVTKASADSVDTIKNYMNGFAERELKAPERSVTKFLKDNGWPAEYDQLEQWQADKLLDFIEEL